MLPDVETAEKRSVGQEQTTMNHLTGASTVLNWTDFRFGTSLDDSEFTQTALRRVR